LNEIPDPGAKSALDSRWKRGRPVLEVPYTRGTRTRWRPTPAKETPGGVWFRVVEGSKADGDLVLEMSTTPSMDPRGPQEGWVRVRMATLLLQADFYAANEQRLLDSGAYPHRQKPADLYLLEELACAIHEGWRTVADRIAGQRPQGEGE